MMIKIVIITYYFLYIRGAMSQCVQNLEQGKQVKSQEWVKGGGGPLILVTMK